MSDTKPSAIEAHLLISQARCLSAQDLHDYAQAKGNLQAYGQEVLVAPKLQEGAEALVIGNCLVIWTPHAAINTDWMQLCRKMPMPDHMVVSDETWANLCSHRITLQFTAVHEDDVLPGKKSGMSPIQKNWYRARAIMLVMGLMADAMASSPEQGDVLGLMVANARKLLGISQARILLGPQLHFPDMAFCWYSLVPIAQDGKLTGITTMGLNSITGYELELRDDINLPQDQWLVLVDQVAWATTQGLQAQDGAEFGVETCHNLTLAEIPPESALSSRAAFQIRRTGAEIVSR